MKKIYHISLGSYWSWIWQYGYVAVR